MTEKLPVRKGKFAYSEDEIDECLTVLAHSRHSTEAVETLQKMAEKNPGGPTPDRRTLSGWRDRYADRYLEIRERTKLQREKLVHDRLDNTLKIAQEAIDEGARQWLDDLRDGKISPADKVTGAQKMAIIFGITLDKKFQIEGRPTSTSVHLNGAQVLRELRQHGKVFDAEGTAEEEGK